MYWRRRLLAAVIVVVAFSLVGFGVRQIVALASGSPAAISSRHAGPPAPPRPTYEPGGGRSLFPSHRLVAFYGTPGLPTLGVLGDAPPEQMWPKVVSAAVPFARPGATVVPAYELIAFAAQAAPEASGNYTLRLTDAQIESYLQVVRAHGGMLILDIQPGLSSFLDDARTLAPWLNQPDVGLALDPEWELAPEQRPGQVVGHTSGVELNQISAWLQQLTTAHNLPQKLLLIHQFNLEMVQDKAAVNPEPDVALTFNMDGFGKPKDKISVYNLLAVDQRWHLGYKVFYQRDTPVQAPTDVPRPRSHSRRHRIRVGPPVPNGPKGPAQGSPQGAQGHRCRRRRRRVFRLRILPGNRDKSVAKLSAGPTLVRILRRFPGDSSGIRGRTQGWRPTETRANILRPTLVRISTGDRWKFVPTSGLLGYSWADARLWRWGPSSSRLPEGSGTLRPLNDGRRAEGGGGRGPGRGLPSRRAQGWSRWRPRLGAPGPAGAGRLALEPASLTGCCPPPWGRLGVQRKRRSMVILPARR